MGCHGGFHDIKYYNMTRKENDEVCEENFIIMKLIWHNYLLVSSLDNCATKLCTETDLNVIQCLRTESTYSNFITTATLQCSIHVCASLRQGVPSYLVSYSRGWNSVLLTRIRIWGEWVTVRVQEIRTRVQSLLMRSVNRHKTSRFV